MCYFLSALILPSSEIVCDPEHTDSHEDLIDSRGLSDSGRGEFVRVAFVPPNHESFSDPATYTLRVDNDVRPEWFTEALERHVTVMLRDRISRMIVLNERKILLGGCWIAGKTARIAKLQGGKIVILAGGMVNEVWAGGRVNEVWDGGRVNKVLAGGRVVHDYRRSK